MNILRILIGIFQVATLQLFAWCLLSISVYAAEPPDADSIEFISYFELMTPKSMKLCSTNNPWLLGEKQLDQKLLYEGDCFGIKARIASQAYVYIYMQTDTAAPVALLSPGCDALNLARLKFDEGEEFFAPQNSQGVAGTLTLDNSKGQEWIYIVAIQDDKTRKRWESRVGTLATACGDSHKGGVTDIDAFVKIMRELQLETRKLDWDLRAFLHK